MSDKMISAIENLEEAGYRVREWSGRRETRYYLRDSQGNDCGYFVEEDVESHSATGTFRGITRRSGSVCSIARDGEV